MITSGDFAAALRLGDLSMLPSNRKSKKSKVDLKPKKALTVSILSTSDYRTH